MSKRKHRAGHVRQHETARREGLAAGREKLARAEAVKVSDSPEEVEKKTAEFMADAESRSRGNF